MIEITNNHIYCIAQYLCCRNKSISYIYTLRLSIMHRKLLYSAMHNIKNGINVATECTENDWCEAYCILTALHKLKVHVESLKYANLSDWM